MRRPSTGLELLRFIRCDEGATAIEYALIAGGISIAIVGSVSTLGGHVMTVFYDKLSTLF